MGKSFSPKTLVNHSFKTFDISQKWVDCIGEVEHGFKIFIWGDSGSGKTTFTFMLCDELSKFGKVYWNDIEQGWCKSLQDNYKTANIRKSANIMIGDRDSWEQMFAKLKTNRAKFLVINSVQHMNINYNMYEELKTYCKRTKKCLILISHAKGANPDGKYASRMRYDADVKLFVERGTAKAKSRYGATKPFRIFGSKPQKGQTIPLF